MAWRAVAATVPKDDGDQNQDAYEIRPEWIAIADGTSSGFDSGSWARVLAAHAAMLCGDAERSGTASAALAAMTKSRSVDLVMAAGVRLVEVQQRFHSAGREQPPNAGSAYVREAQSRGASSTLALARISPDHRRLSLFALGDTCWFVLRNGTVRSSFPYHSAAEFAEQPRLIFSTPGRLGAHSRVIALTRAVRALRDPKHPISDIATNVPFDAETDQLLGCTDAIAQWLLTDDVLDRSHRLQRLLDSLGRTAATPRSGEKPRKVSAMKWKRLQRRGKSSGTCSGREVDSGFEALVDQERTANNLKRDDSTVVLASWEQGGQH